MGIFSALRKAAKKDSDRNKKLIADVAEAAADWKRCKYNELKSKLKIDQRHWRRLAEKAKKRGIKANKKITNANGGHYADAPWDRSWVWNKGKSNEVRYDP